jgi:DNA-binding GntR family transcriptional regulator
MGNAATKLDVQVERLQRATLQERVYRQMAELILDGGIAPGQQVTIHNLAEAFGVSTMPVREALKRLTAANALTVVSGRTIGIAPLSLERLTDLRNVRIEIEGAAVSWAANNANSDKIDELEGLLGKMDSAVKAGNSKQFLRENRAFHFSIYEMADSPTLVAIIESLWLQIGPYLSLLRESGNYVSANLHHKDMFMAIQRGDAEKAAEAIRGDINDAYHELVSILGK